MTYKIIGAVMIIISAVCACSAVIVIEKKHLEQLKALLSLVTLIEVQIDNFNLPIPEILKKADRNLLVRCGFEENEVPNLTSLRLKKDLLLDAKEKKELFEFTDTLGHAYKDGQIASCRHCRTELEKLCTERKNNFSKKTRLTLTLGICAALALIIFML